MRAHVSPVQKALWFMESHLGSEIREITLEDIASVAGVSRYHLTRAFGEATGQSIMRYLRGRRLTEAARCLANGAPDILAVALDAGYGSHEAFTRISLSGAADRKVALRLHPSFRTPAAAVSWKSPKRAGRQ
jgi:AraC-like DNA-binding protein